MAYVFGYGSLMSASSAERTLRRPVQSADMKIARANGVRRAWTYVTQCCFEVDDPGKARPTLFLDVQEEEGQWCNGLLIPVAVDELAALDRRERGYERVNWTARMEIGLDAEVYTYSAVGDFLADPMPEAAVVPENYVALVEDAVRAVGEDFAEDYNRTTGPVPRPMLAGNYRFANDDQEAAARRASEGK